MQAGFPDEGAEEALVGAVLSMAAANVEATGQFADAVKAYMERNEVTMKQVWQALERHSELLQQAVGMIDRLTDRVIDLERDNV